MNPATIRTQRYRARLMRGALVVHGEMPRSIAEYLITSGYLSNEDSHDAHKRTCALMTFVKSILGTPSHREAPARLNLGERKRGGSDWAA
jgi:hypothetical protein